MLVSGACSIWGRGKCIEDVGEWSLFQIWGRGKCIEDVGEWSLFDMGERKNA
jgi:hypothetical protein